MNLLLILGALGIGWGTLFLRGRMVEWDDSWTRGRLCRWAGQGVLTPLILYLVYCGGMGGVSPPWISWLAQQAGISKSLVVVALAFPAMAVIVSFWGALTFLWFLRLVYVRVAREDRAEFGGLCGVWAVLTAPFWGGLLWTMSWLGAGLATSLAAGVMVSVTLPLIPIRKRCPLYARAIAQIKLGKYSAAEQEVIGQLERCEDDFEGWMMLAELYAVHFHDFAAAEQTVAQLAQQENLGDAHLATALHRLAQWQLKLNQDPAGARITLEEIGRRLPGTNLARMAAQQIEQLPASREEIQDRLKVRPVRLSAGVDPFIWREDSGDRELGATEANALALRLERDPDDVETREMFAWLLAERVGKVDLAFEQLDLLMGMPGQPDGKQARWLALAAAWELRHRRDLEASRSLMKRLVNEHPTSPEAFAAQRRLNLMDMEHRMNEARSRQAAVPRPRVE